MKTSKPKFKPSKKDKKPADSAVKKNSYALKGSIWIEGESGTFLGYGRVILLERIKQYGSISEAAKSMEMSYRHAWELVDSLNRQAKKPLVETSTGGRDGGGAELTNAGKRAIEIFWRLHERFKGFLKNEAKNLKF
ncbi:MAG: LysR family transcriptional regulator [Nitrospiraceae bacterium]|nr:LysR family transcriptional regulator [Nitrospiraceae bacterium]